MNDRNDKSPRRATRRTGAANAGAAKRKVDPFVLDKSLKIDWRDAQTLSRFITERGKIVPRRVSGVTAKNQRKLARAIKTARLMGILPYGGHRVPLRNLV